MSIQTQRDKFERSAKWLRRARRLYAALIYKACLTDKTNRTLWLCADRALEAGLYQGEDKRSVRWSLMRKFWRMTPGYERGRGWFAWIEDYGLHPDHLAKVKIVRRVA